MRESTADRQRSESTLVRRRGMGRVSLMAAMLVVVSLVAAVGVGALRMNSLYREAERLRVEAVAQRQTAEALSEFLSQMLVSSDPMAPRDPSPSPSEGSADRASGRALMPGVALADLLNEARATVSTSLGDRPEVEAGVRETIGKSLAALGHHGEASEELQKALDIRRRVLGAAHPDTLHCMGQLGVALRHAHRHAEAEALLESARKRMKSTLGPDDPETLRVSAQLAVVLFQQGKIEDCDRMFRSTLMSQRRAFGGDHRDTLETVKEWSIAYLQQGRSPEGPDLARDFSEITRRTLTAHDPLRLLAEGIRGYWHAEAREFEQAEALLRPAIDHARHILGVDHPLPYFFQRALAQSLRGDEFRGEKERLYRAALAGMRTTLQEGSYQTINTLSSLANLLNAQERYDEAIELNREAVETYSRSRGETSFATSYALNILTNTLLKAGRQDEARDVVRRRIAAGNKRIEDPEASAGSLNRFAWFLLTCQPEDLRDPAAAQVVALRAVERAGGSDASTLDTLALAYHLSGDHDKAVETETKALEFIEVDARERVGYVVPMIKFLVAQKGEQAARVFLQEEIGRAKEAFGTDDPRTTERLKRLRTSLTEQGMEALAKSVPATD